MPCWYGPRCTVATCGRRCLLWRLLTGLLVPRQLLVDCCSGSLIACDFQTHWTHSIYHSYGMPGTGAWSCRNCISWRCYIASDTLLGDNDKFTKIYDVLAMWLGNCRLRLANSNKLNENPNNYWSLRLRLRVMSLFHLMSPDRIDINLLSLLAQQSDMRAQQRVKHENLWEIVVNCQPKQPLLPLRVFFLVTWS